MYFKQHFYKILKTLNYSKKNSIFFFFKEINNKFDHKIYVKQNFNIYKIINNISWKIFDNSVFKNLKITFNGFTFICNFKKFQMSKQTIINFSAIIINNKIHQNALFKNSYSLKYKMSQQIFFQFISTALKKSK